MFRYAPIALSVLLTLTLSPTNARQAIDPQTYLAAAESEGFAGVVLIVQGDEILLRQGYGIADESGDEPFAPDTAFGIGSLSKQFTAAAILQLAAQGQIELYEPISHYFDGVPADKSDITIHQILTHTAGFPRHNFRSDTLDISRQAAVETILSTPLEFEPGEDFHYADSSYVLLAALVEEISGQPFTSYLHQHFFEPVGMNHTGFFGETQWQAYPVAVGYHNSRSQGSPAFWPSPGWALLGAGGLISTVDDLHLWVQALNAGTILPAEAVEQLFAPHVAITDRVSYGYGWFVQDTSYGGQMIWHAGAGNSHNADLRFFPESDTLFIIGSNRIDDFFVTDQQHPFFGRFDEIIYSTQTNDDLTYALLTGDYAVPPIYVDLPGIKASALRTVAIPVGLILAIVLGRVLYVVIKRRTRPANPAQA